MIKVYKTAICMTYNIEKNTLSKSKITNLIAEDISCCLHSNYVGKFSENFV